MSNVTGEAVEDVASYMTSIWNNFEGTYDQLERYADVITALGAATASSSEEIAGGLQEFASIAQTVGLSYEYATSALATVVATTRQSESVVGTAFKTIFSRLQGLSLGSTLEDGTNLNKYSTALHKVGVEILDTEGNMKDLDTILDDLASKWDVLTAAQKTALAQTVAGTRQYNQLIALMDNWDFMKENLATAANSEGSLQEQADIYAESWEAARKRVQASAQAIYQDLLDDDFFIKMTDAFSGLLTIVDDMIDGLGGLKGVLLAVASIFLTTYKNDVTQALQGLQFNLSSAEQKQAQVEQVRQGATEALKNMYGDDASASGGLASQAYAQQAAAQESLYQNAEHMSESQKKIAQTLLDQHSTMVAQVATQKELVDETEAKLKADIQTATVKGTKKNASTDNKAKVGEAATGIKQSKAFETAMNEMFPEAQSFDEMEVKIKAIETAFDNSRDAMAEAFGEEGVAAFETFKQNVENAKDSAVGLEDAINELGTSVNSYVEEQEQAVEEVKQLAPRNKEAAAAIDSMVASAENAGTALGEEAVKTAQVVQSTENLDKVMTSLKKKSTALDGLVSLGAGLSTFAMTLSTLSGAFETIQGAVEGTISPLKAVTSVISSFSMTALMVVNTVKNLDFAGIGILVGNLGPKFTSLATSMEAASAAGATLGTKFAAVGSLLGAALPYMIAIGAAIAAITLAVKALYNASPEGVLKKATTAASEAASAAQDCADAYSDIKDALEDLDSQVSSLEDLQKGTAEWRQGILEANDSLIDLLSTYDMLNSDNFTVDSSGLMQITDSAKQQLLDAAEQRSAAATSANYYAQIQKNNAQAAVDTKNVSGGGLGILSGAMKDAITNGIANGSLSSSDLVTGSEKLAQVLADSVDSSKEEVASIVEDIASNETLQDKLVELGTIVSKNTESNRVLANQMVESNFGDEIDSSGLDEAGQSALSNLLGEALLDATNTAVAEIGHTQSRKDVRQEYADAMGYTYQKSFNPFSTGVTYTDAQGNEVGKVSDNTARQYLAQQQAKDSLQDDMSDYIASIDNLIKAGNEVSDGVGDILAGFSGGKVGDLSSLTAGQVNDFESNIDTIATEDNAKASGYDTVEAYKEGLQAAVDDYRADSETIGDDVLSTAVKGIFSGFKSDTELTNAGKEAVANVLEDAFVANGRDAAQTVASLFDSDKVSDVDGFATALDGVDWDSTSVSELKTTMEEAGVETNLTDEDWNNLISTLQSSHGIAEEAAEDYQALHDVIDSLTTGDTISEEDYQALGGDIYDSFFLKMADGTYKLTTDAQTFYDIVNKESIDNFKDNISQITDLQNSGYDIETLSQSALTGEKNGKGTATYNGDQVRTQLEYLQSAGYSDTKQLAEWQDAIANKSGVTVDMINQIGEAVANNSAAWSDFDGVLEDSQEQLASTATNLSDLHEMLDNGEISVEAFTKAAMAMDAAADLEGLDTEELQEYSKYLQEAADGMDNFNDSMSDSEARTVAKGIMKMNSAIETLADKFVDSGKDADSWSSILKKSSKTSEEYAEAMIGTKDAVADLLDISSEYVTSDFIIDHLDEIAEAATGSATAIDSLKSEIADSVIDTLGDQLASSSAEAEKFKSEMQGLVDQANQFDDLEVGASVYLEGEDGFVEALNALIQETGMTVDQVNALCDSMGFEANFASEGQPVDTTIPEYTTHHEITSLKYNELDDGTKVPMYEEKSWTEQTGEHVAEGEAAAFSMTTDGSVPKINSVTKKASGSSNNYSSSNTGGKSSPGSSSSKGSSGSSSKPKTKDKEKKNDDEPELYHEIKESIKDVEHELTKLDKAQSHMYGGELIASLKQENSLLSQQRANYAELNRQIEARQEVLRQTLAAYGDPEDYYGMFNSIQESYNAAVDAYNKLVEAYNNMTAAEQEAYETTLDNAKTQLELDKDRYDKMQGYLTEYYTNKDSLRSNDEKQQELLYQQIENNLEAYETEIQLKLDATEAERSLAKFLKNMKQDIKNLYKTSSEWADEFALSKTNAQTYATDAQTRIDQLNKYKSIYASGDWGNEGSLFATESEALQAIVDTENQLLEDSDNLFQEYQDAYENLLDALNEITEQFDDILDDFEAIDDTLDHYEKIIEMLHGTTTDQGMQELSQLYDTQVKSSLAQQSSLRDYIQALQKAKADALAMGYEEDDEYVINIQEEIDSKNAELEETIEAYLDTIQAQLENSVNMAKSVMDKAIWGNSVDNVQQEWDDKKAQAEGYYDEVERIYQLESLESKWRSAINSADSLKAQQQLQEIMEAQVAALENKTALSEKDIELAEKEIEVYQAQMALEEAQNAKDSMKLTRDESGNWSYQYVADEDNVAESQQDYIDKLNEWRSAAMTATQEIKETVLTAYTEFTDRMTEIMEDVTMSDEERAAAIEELNETYWGEEGIITLAVEDSNYLQQEANEATFLELQGLYAADPEYYAQMTETEKALIDDLRDQGITDYQTLRDYIIGSDGQSGAYGEILNRAQEVNEQCSEAWNSMAADAITLMYGKDGKLDRNSVTGVVNTAYAAMQQALAYYDQAVYNSEVASGIEWSQVQNQLANVSNSIDGVTARVGNVISQISGLNSFAQEVLYIADVWYQVAASIRQATSDLANYLSLLTGSTISVGDATYGSTSSSSTPTTSTSSNKTSTSSTGNDGKLSVGDTATLSGNYYYTSQGATPLGNRYSGVENGVVVDMVNDKYGDYSYHIHSADGVYQDLGWVKKNQLSGYATGGYTGEWNGGDGRLALLHSKELVLNQSDTENLLSAVNAVRDMSSLGSSIASSVASGVANLVRNMLGMTENGSSSIYGGSTSDATNNNFEITMNVDGGNVEEIKSAILSLPTLASQYLSRRSI